MSRRLAVPFWSGWKASRCLASRCSKPDKNLKEEEDMQDRLEDIAAAMVAKGKGLLAADESSATIKKRFDAIGLASTEQSRRDYREMLFRTEPAMRQFISG